MQIHPIATMDQLSETAVFPFSMNGQDLTNIGTIKIGVLDWQLIVDVNDIVFQKYVGAAWVDAFRIHGS